MNLPDIARAAAEHDPALFKSTALAKEVEKAIAGALGLHTSDEWWIVRSKQMAVGLWLLFTFATGVVAVGGAVKVIDIDRSYFTPLWTVFGTGFAGVVVAVVRSQWRRDR